MWRRPKGPQPAAWDGIIRPKSAVWHPTTPREPRPKLPPMGVADIVGRHGPQASLPCDTSHDIGWSLIMSCLVASASTSRWLWQATMVHGCCAAR